MLRLEDIDLWLLDSLMVPVSLHDVDGRPADQHLVIGQVLGIHLDDDAIVDGAVNTATLRPVARLGGPADYTVVEEVFRMVRPTR